LNHAHGRAVARDPPLLVRRVRKGLWRLGTIADGGRQPSRRHARVDPDVCRVVVSNGAKKYLSAGQRAPLDGNRASRCPPEIEVLTAVAPERGPSPALSSPSDRPDDRRMTQGDELLQDEIRPTPEAQRRIASLEPLKKTQVVDEIDRRLRPRRVAGSAHPGVRERLKRG